MDTRQRQPRNPPLDPGRGFAAAPFPGLPNGIGRFEFVRLAREIGSDGGWTPAMIEHLELLLSYTRPQDWEAGARPVVWLSVKATAAALGVCTSTVRNHERAMEALGAISVTPAGNRRRGGHRREDGTIAWAYGVELAPLLVILPRLEQEATEQRRRSEIFTQARVEALGLQQRLQDAIDAAVGRGGGARGAAALRERVRRIGERWRRCRRIQGVLAWCSLLERLLALVLRAAGKRQADRKAVDSAATAAAGFGDHGNRISRQWQLKLATEVNYLQMDPDSYQVSPEAGAEAPSLPPKRDRWGNCLQGGRIEGAGNAGGGRGHAQTARSEKVPIGAIADLVGASDIVWVDDPDNWNDLVDGAHRACAALGITQESWADACQGMGRYPAAAAVILTALKFERGKVWAPDGYLRAMTWRALHGQLHLARSVFGWLIEVGQAAAQPSGRELAPA